MAKKKYMSMQEELAARKAARGENIQSGRATIRSENSQTGSFRAFTGKAKKRATDSNPLSSISDQLTDAVEKVIKREDKDGKISGLKKYKTTDATYIYGEPVDSDASDGHFTRETSEKKTSKAGTFIIAVITLAVAAIIFSTGIFEDDGYYDDTDGTEETLDIDYASDHQQVLEYLEQELYIDWDIDPNDVKEWSDRNLDRLVGDTFPVWEAEVSREYIIIRTIGNMHYNEEKQEEFDNRCHKLSSRIEGALEEEFDSYPSIVIEARMSAATDGPGTIEDNTNLVYLSIDGYEEFSYYQW